MLSPSARLTRRPCTVSTPINAAMIYVFVNECGDPFKREGIARMIQRAELIVCSAERVSQISLHGAVSGGLRLGFLRLRWQLKDGGLLPWH